jgi:hypothetical protein
MHGTTVAPRPRRNQAGRGNLSLLPHPHWPRRYRSALPCYSDRDHPGSRTNEKSVQEVSRVRSLETNYLICSTSHSLHSNKRTSTRSAPRSAIGVRRRIGAAPLARRNRSGRRHQNDRSVQRGYRAKLRGSAFHSRYVPFGHRQRRPRLRSLTATRLLGVSAATEVNTARR